MDVIKEVWDFIINELGPHWIGLILILIISIVAQTLKVHILTRSLAKRFKVIFWLRRVFPLVLLLSGALIGVFASGPLAPGVETRGVMVLYTTGCAGISIVFFNVFKQWIKRKFDVDIMANTD